LVTEVGVIVRPVQRGVTTVLFGIVFSQIAGVVVCPFTKHFAVYVPVGVAGMVTEPFDVARVCRVLPSGRVNTTE
jgi:hypothetical protein